MSLVSARWPGVVAELDRLIGVQRGNILRAVSYARERGIVVPCSPERLLEMLAAAVPELLRRRFLEDLRSTAHGDKPPANRAALADEIRDLAAEYLGEAEGIAALGRLKGFVRARLNAELEALEASMIPWRTPVADEAIIRPTGLYTSAVDMLFDQAVEYERRRADLVARIAALAPTEADPVSAAAQHVAQAVADANGRDFLVSRVIQARHVRGVFYANDPAAHALATAEIALRNVSADLDRLPADSPAPSDYATELVKAKEELTARVATLRAEIDARQAADLADLVDAALAGDDAAREALEVEVRSAPRVFPRGLAEQIRWHGQLVEDLEGLAAELAR